MNHLGDITKISGASIAPVDIITFGSPCQDLSVAGKRAGIQDGERSNLFFEAVRVIKEMRGATNGEYPKYAVWENVPGAFSSNKGWDFHAVLEAFCAVKDDTVSIPKPYDAKRTKLVWNKAGEIVGDNYSVAWRMFDAQYWGVPQRRKRIYLVADFTGRRAGEILLKPDSLRGYMPQGNEEGQGAAADAVGGIDGGVGVVGLTNRGIECETAFETLRSGSHGALPLVAQKVYSFDSLSSNSMKSSNPFSGCRAVDAVAYCMTTGTYTQTLKEQSPTLMARDYKDPPVVNETEPEYIVRRLTPTECARLQGFPDDWGHLAPYNPEDAEFWEDVRKTHAKINGKVYKPVKDIKKWYDKLHTDSAEYKMWGNGIALPNAIYVLQGIAGQGAKTLGSLFDGSGGFPLAGVINGIKPIWASEVEPYPIAVTRSRFNRRTR